MRILVLLPVFTVVEKTVKKRDQVILTINACRQANPMVSHAPHYLYPNS